jgi:hypothetical protein
MNGANDAPEWWSEVVNPPITSKADAGRIIRLCREGEFLETWKPQWSTYLTAEGRIRLADFERAQDILMGTARPSPGRKGFHDWEKIDRLIDAAAADMGQRVVRTEVCLRVSEKYSISPVSITLRKRVSDRMKATGR